MDSEHVHFCTNCDSFLDAMSALYCSNCLQREGESWYAWRDRLYRIRHRIRHSLVVRAALAAALDSHDARVAA